MSFIETLRAKLRVLASPVALVLIVSLLLIIANLLITQHTYSYDSDDVSWQTTLQTWRPFSGQKAYVGSKDNFLANVPVILLFQHVFHMTRTQLLAEALCFAVLNFVLFYFAALYFLRKAGITPSYSSLVPFIWLASFGAGFVVAFMNTNWRDYEFGLSFVTYMIAAKYYFNEISPYRSSRSKLLTLLLFLLAALYTYSDPYFFYFALLPVAGAFAALWAFQKVSRQQALTVIGFALLALVSSRVLMSVMARVGIIAPRGAESLTTIHTLHRTLDQLVDATGTLFGINFSRNALAALGNLLLLAVIIALIIFFVVRRSTVSSAKTPRNRDMLRFFGLLSIFSVVAYIAIGNALVGNGRYLIPSVYTGLLVLVFALGNFRGAVRNCLLAVLVFTTVLNITISFNRLQTSAAAAAAVNRSNYKLVAKLKSLGLTKGYTGYWDGNINTYLSQGTETFLPITCSYGKTVPLTLLVNGSLYTKPASRTFLLINPAHSLPKLCSMSSMLHQFGAPSQTLNEGNSMILIYGYDLATKMPPQ